jgi:hypothetical protein
MKKYKIKKNKKMVPYVPEFLEMKQAENYNYFYVLLP